MEVWPHVEVCGEEGERGEGRTPPQPGQDLIQNIVDVNIPINIVMMSDQYAFDSQGFLFQLIQFKQFTK